MNHDMDIVVQPIGTFEGAPEGHEAEPLANWATLTRFEVQVNQRSKITAPVFANGRQQVPVEIVIEARDKDNVVVSLSSAQLRSIKLINYNTSTEIANVTHEHDPRFVYHWDAAQEAGADAARGDKSSVDATRATAQTVMLYVTTTAVSATKVAAEIISPNDGVFRTNTPNPAPGKFDSWVNIHGQQEPKYYHTDLQMERVDQVTNSNWDVDLYYIKFKEPTFNIVDSQHLDVDANQPHVNKMPILGRVRVHIAFKAGQKGMMTFPQIGGFPGVQFPVNQRPGQATAVRCSYNGLHSYYPEIRLVGACVYYFNQYGNYARCAIANTYTDDYNTIRLQANEHG